MLPLPGVPSLPACPRAGRAYHRHADRSFRPRPRPVTGCIVPVSDRAAWCTDFRRVTVPPDVLRQARGQAVEAPSSAPGPGITAGANHHRKAERHYRARRGVTSRAPHPAGRPGSVD